MSSQIEGLLSQASSHGDQFACREGAFEHRLREIEVRSSQLDANVKQLGASLGSAIQRSINQRLVATKVEDCPSRSATLSAPSLLEVELQVHKIMGQHVKEEIMPLVHEHCVKVASHVASHTSGLLETMDSKINKSVITFVASGDR